MQKETKKQDR